MTADTTTNGTTTTTRNDIQNGTPPKTEDGVQIGPDLNESRNPHDKKLYRQIILPNGLRVVLVSDTIAMQSGEIDYYDDDESDDDDSSEEEEKEDCEMKNAEESDSDSSEEEEEEDNGPRKAAASLLVGTGSFYDPPCAPGMAHFCEHMLFMGTEKYPQENAYDLFLTKCGGSDNAYTEDEHTMYHLEIPQEKFFQALDMLAQFFISPLMLQDAVDRELNAIESEFQLSKNSDECRQQMLLCHQCLKQEEKKIENNGNGGKKANVMHPFVNFGWGNMESLKTTPEKNGVNVMKELRKFYDAHYYAENMALVVVGAFPLDVLQEQVTKTFSSIPRSSRLDGNEDPFYEEFRMRRENPRTFEVNATAPIERFGLPFERSSLGKICRIVPVKDRHTLTLSWQIPPQWKNWKAKPCDYVAHLLGHEASGSLLSELKRRSWVNSCYAGVGGSGFENASSHALFSLSFTLLEEGVRYWGEIVEYVYMYVGMMRHYCRSEGGLPSWIYEELHAIQEVSYKYQDECEAVYLAEELADSLAPYKRIPAERLLDGNELLFEFDGGAIKDLLDKFMTPENTIVNLMSSTFGRASDYEDGDVTMSSGDMIEIEPSTEFSVSSAGEPNVEPIFGTRYWLQKVSPTIMEKWVAAAEPKMPSPSSGIRLPPVNPFVPENFDLKPTPSDDMHHPLLYCSLMISVTVKKKKLRFPCTVTKYDGSKNQVLLTYEDEDEKWHKVDLDISKIKNSTILPSYEGTFDDKSTRFKVLAVPKDGEGAIFKFGDDSDWDVEDGIHFPPIPPKMLDSRMPQLIHNTKLLKIWLCQDRKFKRPIAEFRLNIVCADANKSPLHKGCADILAHLCHDAITETSYLASVCNLENSISSTDVGFTIRVYGMNDKLLDLAEVVLSTLFSFKTSDFTLPENVKSERFSVCQEVLLRKYANSGMKVSSLSSDVRLRCIRSTIWSPNAKAKAIKDLSVSKFMEIASNLFSKISVECLYHGNVDNTDAMAAKDLICRVIPGSKGIPQSKYPSQHVLIVTPTKNLEAVVPSLDKREPNTAVEVYFQVGKDNILDRVLIDLLVHIIEEPLFNQLRTKEQFGYQVSCGSRWTYGIMGMSFEVVTACKSAAEVDARIDTFLTTFREELVSMSEEFFLENVVGLAKTKLQKFNALDEECGFLWGEITEHRHDWDVHRNEAISLRSITKAQTLDAYDKWLNPQAKNRRRLTVHAIGASEGIVSLGRPDDSSMSPEDIVDDSVNALHRTAGKKTWGQVTYTN